LKKRLEKKRRVAYQLLKERESRAAKLKMMTSEMAYQKEVQSARGHKRKIKREKDEEDALPGLAHLKKAPAQFKWKRKRLK
jgi:U3 small nucleolar RNA-associated protein 11